MSKTAKAKSRQPSIHSRAARRATSPSLQGNVSQSLKDIQPPPRKKSTTHLFSGPQSSGIRKKKGNKQLKRSQLERQRKGVERADIVANQLDAKLTRSLGRLRTIKERRKEWENVNKEAERSLGGDAEGTGSRFAGLDEALKEEVEIIETEEKLEAMGDEFAGLAVKLPKSGGGGGVDEPAGESKVVESAKTAEDEEDVVL